MVKLTPELVGKLRVHVINALGREPSITMLGVADFGLNYHLYYGVAEIEREVFAPFTMREGRDDLRFWGDLIDEDPAQAASKATSLITDFISGYEKDPHA